MQTPDHLKTRTGEESFNPDGLVQRSIRLLKDKFPNLEVFTDVALDPYNSDGHDGIVRDDGVILNDETVEFLCRQAVSQVRACPLFFGGEIGGRGKAQGSGLGGGSPSLPIDARLALGAGAVCSELAALSASAPHLPATRHPLPTAPSPLSLLPPPQPPVLRPRRARTACRPPT